MSHTCLLNIEIAPLDVFNTISDIVQCMHIENNSSDEMHIYSILSTVSSGVIVKVDDTADYIVSPGCSIDEVHKTLQALRSSLPSSVTLRSYSTLKELLHVLKTADPIRSCTYTDLP